jgi:hypothetical protein
MNKTTIKMISPYFGMGGQQHPQLMALWLLKYPRKAPAPAVGLTQRICGLCHYFIARNVAELFLLNRVFSHCLLSLLCQ